MPAGVRSPNTSVQILARLEVVMAQRRSYSIEQKQGLVQRALREGLTAVARREEVPVTTLANWMPGGRSPVPLPDPEPASAPAEPSPEPVVAPAEDPETDPPADKPVAKSYTPSQKARILEYAADHGPSKAARKFGVTRFSIREWRNQVRRAAAGEGDSPTTGPSDADLAAKRDREILAEYHKHPGLGPSQIRNQLRRRGIKVAVHTVREVMIGDGYRPPKVQRHPHDERFEAVRPNHLWHLDFLHRHINRATTFTLILLDDHSRYVVGHGVDDAERADLVIDTFEEAVRRHGKPEMVLHDKGAAFWAWNGISRFTALLTELGIDQIPAEHKEWNGKLEVFNANLAKELFNVQRFYDVAEMRRRLAAHLHFYNHDRTSHALGGLLVPADRYYGRADDVLARIEAGLGRDPTGELDLRDRCLELFKVTSQDGRPEIWLMGQRLFGLPAK